MARIRKCKLNWTLSDSDQVAGYRLYWSKGERVGYDSNFMALGKVGEVFLPDVLQHVPRDGAPIMLGITAVDVMGNESDMTTLAEPYRPAAPPAPAGFSLTTLDDFDVVDPRQQALNHFDALIEEDPRQDIPEQPARQKKPLLGFGPAEGKVKYYDDVGYRKPIIGK